MKKILLFVAALILLSGCAAQTYRTARAHANMVKNGMTVDQASDILGMPPTHTNGDLVQWRRGNAQTYTGTAMGSIEFHVVNGRITDVPEGGIFSPAAVALIDERTAELAKKYDLVLQEQKQAAAAAEAAQAEKDRIAAEARKQQQEKDAAQRLKDIAAEVEAAEKSVVTCKDKTTCTKVFALAQIYVQQHSDQKIQVATDTIIETYNPTEKGRIGITITKMPRAGTIEVIKISPQCNEDDFNERSCRLRRTEVYRGFKPFIEKSLAM